MPWSNAGISSCDREMRNSQRMNYCFDEISCDRFATFLPKSFLTAELDPRATFSASIRLRAGAFKIIRSKLDVRTKFLLKFFFRPGPMKESRGERSKIRSVHLAGASLVS